MRAVADGVALVNRSLLDRSPTLRLSMNSRAHRSAFHGELAGLRRNARAHSDWGEQLCLLHARFCSSCSCTRPLRPAFSLDARTSCSPKRPRNGASWPAMLPLLLRAGAPWSQVPSRDAGFALLLGSTPAVIPLRPRRDRTRRRPPLHLEPLPRPAPASLSSHLAANAPVTSAGSPPSTHVQIPFIDKGPPR